MKKTPDPIDIKSLRSRLGLIQEDMAREVGVAVSTYVRWELGLHAPGGLAVRRRLIELQQKADANETGNPAR